MAVIAKRAYHGRVLGRLERQRRVVVLQQHHRAGCVLSGECHRIGPHLRRRRVGHVDVWVLEQPGAELHPQDAPHGIVEPRHRDLVVGQQLGAEVADQRAGHLGVQPGVQCLGCRVRPVRREAVPAVAGVGVHGRARAHLGNGGPVRLDKAVEAPLALEDVGQGLVIAAAGHAVDRVERAHHRIGAGVDGRFERRQVEVAQPLLGHVGRVVVTAALGLAVGGEVLRASDLLVRRAVVGSLRALDPRGGHGRAEVRVLAGTLRDPTPAWFVRDVDHRGVGLLEPDRGRLAGTDRGVVHGHLRVEAARRCQRNREDRPEAMDRVEREQQRDVQPRLLDRDVLKPVDLYGIGDTQHRAEAILHLLIGDQEVG